MRSNPFKKRARRCYGWRERRRSLRPLNCSACGLCARRHIEVIITDAAQTFIAIFAPFPQCNASPGDMALRRRQFRAIEDKGKCLRIAKDIVRRKIIAEGHGKTMRAFFLDSLTGAPTTAAVRRVEAESAQHWWARWRDFEIVFEKGFRPPAEWRTFKARLIGRPLGRSR
jgi:CRISPR/Cas system-associated endonuclease Cas1